MEATVSIEVEVPIKNKHFREIVRHYAAQCKRTDVNTYRITTASPADLYFIGRDVGAKGAEVSSKKLSR